MNGTIKQPTRSDVARLAGVSKTTVSFVLNHRYDIAIPEQTRERVREAVRQLGYRPNVVAKALSSGRTNSLSLVIPFEILPYYARVLRVFERYANEHGYHLIARTIGDGGSRYITADLNALMDSPSDGIILIDMPERFNPYFHQILSGNKPAVFMGVYGDRAMDYVQVDMKIGAMDAMRHLLSWSPKRLAFFAWEDGTPLSDIPEKTRQGQGDPRMAVYYHMMVQANRPVEIIVARAGGRQSARETLQEYVSEKGCPDAIFCMDDEIALSSHRLLRDMGFRLPEDVLLVGCDDSEDCVYVEPPLSSVAQPLEQMCATAWDFMINRLNDPEIPRQFVKLETKFIERKSAQRTTAVTEVQ